MEPHHIRAIAQEVSWPSCCRPILPTVYSRDFFLVGQAIGLTYCTVNQILFLSKYF